MDKQKNPLQSEVKSYPLLIKISSTEVFSFIKILESTFYSWYSYLAVDKLKLIFTGRKRVI